MSQLRAVSEVGNAACTGCGKTIEIDGLEEMGEPWRDSLERTVKCEECIQKSEAADEEKVRAKRIALYHGAVRLIGLPREFVGLGWAAMDETEPDDVVEGERVVATKEEASVSRAEAIAAAQRWAEGKTRGLVLSGRVGLGKSRLAAVAAQAFVFWRVKAMAADRVEAGAQVAAPRYVSVPALVKASRARYESDAREWAERVVSGSSSLVLDDIDKVKPTEFSIDLLFEAIEARTSQERSLLVTTNLRYPELEDLLGEPIASRLAGYCEGRRILGEDRRQS